MTDLKSIDNSILYYRFYVVILNINSHVLKKRDIDVNIQILLSQYHHLLKAIFYFIIFPFSKATRT